MKKYLLLALSFAALTSCSTYKHSYRLSEVPQNKIGVTSTVVDVETDFERKIKASSDRPTTSVQDAKANAYFNAITDNEIDILVDPIYSVKVNRGLFRTTAKAQVSGYAGTFVNPRSAADAKQEGYDAKLAALEDFLEMKEIVNEDKPTNIVTTCCGEGKGSSQTMTFNGAPALMDQFNSFYNGNIDRRINPGFLPSATSVTDAVTQNVVVSKQNLSSSRGIVIGTSYSRNAWGDVTNASRVDYFITKELSIGANLAVTLPWFDPTLQIITLAPSAQYFITDKVFAQINVGVFSYLSSGSLTDTRWGIIDVRANVGYWQSIGEKFAVAPMINISTSPGMGMGLAYRL